MRVLIFYLDYNTKIILKIILIEQSIEGILSTNQTMNGPDRLKTCCIRNDLLFVLNEFLLFLTLSGMKRKEGQCYSLQVQFVVSKGDVYELKLIWQKSF